MSTLGGPWGRSLFRRALPIDDIVKIGYAIVLVLNFIVGARSHTVPSSQDQIMCDCCGSAEKAVWTNNTYHRVGDVTRGQWRANQTSGSTSEQ